MDNNEVRSNEIKNPRNVTFPPRSSSKMLFVSIPVAANLVPPHCRSHAQVCVSAWRYMFLADKHFPSSSLSDWFFFLVLDLGNPPIDSIPAGVRVAIGLLQAVAVRAAGFATVPLLALSPAVQ
jgi:hypothetical protein